MYYTLMQSVYSDDYTDDCILYLEEHPLASSYMSGYP